MDYQEKVSTREDIKALYENVISRSDIRRYRGYTHPNVGDSYGWNPATQDYFRKAGCDWFDNPSYIDPGEEVDFSFDELMKGVS